jgi:hypothetical protein
VPRGRAAPHEATPPIYLSRGAGDDVQITTRSGAGVALVFDSAAAAQAAVPPEQVAADLAEATPRTREKGQFGLLLVGGGEAVRGLSVPTRPPEAVR